MRKHRFRWIGLGSLLAVGLTLALQPSAPAQEKEKVVDIVKDGNGDFVFVEKDITIKVGQSVKWVPKDRGKHNLVPNTPKDNFKETGDFRVPLTGTTPETATQKFDKVTTDAINYRCKYHGTMKGTITVK
jgi:plastocyanin